MPFRIGGPTIPNISTSFPSTLENPICPGLIRIISILSWLHTRELNTHISEFIYIRTLAKRFPTLTSLVNFPFSESKSNTFAFLRPLILHNSTLFISYFIPPFQGYLFFRSSKSPFHFSVLALKVSATLYLLFFRQFLIIWLFFLQLDVL